MIQQFLQKFTRKTGKVEQSFEVVSKEHREIKGLSFEQNEDESIVMDFLNHMDREYDTTPAGRKQQGDAFEQFLAAVFRLANYDVEITRKSYLQGKQVYTGDDSVDLILSKDAERIAVQAKHYRLNTKAPNLITKEFVNKYSGISDKNWTNKLFITTSLFNPHVYLEIEKNEKAQNIEWYDRYGLLQLLNTLIPETMEKHMFLNSLPEQVVKCPECESGFIVQKWNKQKHSYFKGCTMFPECAHTESVSFRHTRKSFTTSSKELDNSISS